MQFKTVVKVAIKSCYNKIKSKFARVKSPSKTINNPSYAGQFPSDVLLVPSQSQLDASLSSQMHQSDAPQLSDASSRQSSTPMVHSSEVWFGEQATILGDHLYEDNVVPRDAPLVIKEEAAHVSEPPDSDDAWSHQEWPLDLLFLDEPWYLDLLFDKGPVCMTSMKRMVQLWEVRMNQWQV